MTAMEERVCVDCFAAMRRGDRSLPVVAWVNDDPLCAMHARAAGWVPELASEMAGSDVPLEASDEMQGDEAVPREPRLNDRVMAHCVRCGRPRHRGRCKGSPWTGRRTMAGRVKKVRVHEASSRREEVVTSDGAESAVVKPAFMSLEATRRRILERDANERSTVSLDSLNEEEITLEEIPKGRQVRKHVGRIGELWVRLEATPPGKAQRVYCRDVEHAGYTARQLREKAKALGRTIEVQPVSSSIYAYLT